MRDVTRTITTTFIKTAFVKIVDGVPQTNVNSDIVVIGDVTDAKCRKIVAREYPGAAVIGIERTEQLYGISPEDFVKYGHKVTDKEKTE